MCQKVRLKFMENVDNLDMVIKEYKKLLSAKCIDDAEEYIEEYFESLPQWIKWLEELKVLRQMSNKIFLVMLNHCSWHSDHITTIPIAAYKTYSSAEKHVNSATMIAKKWNKEIDDVRSDSKLYERYNNEDMPDYVDGIFMGMKYMKRGNLIEYYIKEIEVK